MDWNVYLFTQGTTRHFSNFAVLLLDTWKKIQTEEESSEESLGFLIFLNPLEHFHSSCFCC
jgi:hypothetical protein